MVCKPFIMHLEVTMQEFYFFKFLLKNFISKTNIRNLHKIINYLLDLYMSQDVLQLRANF